MHTFATNSVVAICVLLVPTVEDTAVGVPVKTGLAEYTIDPVPVLVMLFAINALTFDHVGFPSAPIARTWPYVPVDIIGVFLEFGIANKLEHMPDDEGDANTEHSGDQHILLGKVLVVPRVDAIVVVVQ